MRVGHGVLAGAQIPLEDVPSVQKEIVMRCRQQGKPVIVASHLLQSMIEYPTPTRAEVADISDVVRQRADALMLSGESAAGAYPDKAVAVLRAVSGRIEEWCRSVFHLCLSLHLSLSCVFAFPAAVHFVFAYCSVGFCVHAQT